MMDALLPICRLEEFALAYLRHQLLSVRYTLRFDSHCSVFLCFLLAFQVITSIWVEYAY